MFSAYAIITYEAQQDSDANFNEEVRIFKDQKFSKFLKMQDF